MMAKIFCLMVKDRTMADEDFQFGPWLRATSGSGRGIKGIGNSSIENRRTVGAHQLSNPKSADCRHQLSECG